MTVYVDLVAKLAKSKDIEGVLRIAQWVSDNIGRSEPLAAEILKIIKSQKKKLPPSTVLNLYTAANKLGQSVETDQLTLQGIQDSTPGYLKEDAPVSKVNVFPDTVENQLSYARFYSRINKQEQAEHHFREALSRKDISIEVYLDFANHLVSQDRLEEAEAQYFEALRKSPYDSTVHNNLGILYYQQGKLDEAADHFREANAIDPDPTTMNNLANIHTDKGEPKEAETLYLQALSLNPRDPDAHNNYALMLWRLNRDEEADLHFVEAISNNSDDLTYRRNYVKYLVEKRRYKEAEKQINVLSMMAPEDPNVYMLSLIHI